MERTNAIRDLRARCDEVSRQITAMHPLVPGLEEAATQSEILKALFELTKNIEVVKKQLIRLEKRDDSTQL
jgi:hypothetical protein